MMDCELCIDSSLHHRLPANTSVSPAQSISGSSQLVLLPLPAVPVSVMLPTATATATATGNRTVNQQSTEFPLPWKKGWRGFFPRISARKIKDPPVSLVTSHVVFSPSEKRQARRRSRHVVNKAHRSRHRLARVS